MLTTAELQQKVEDITEGKMCQGMSDELLINNAKLAWEEAGGFDPPKTDDPEWKFWWSLLAYRYANLRMRRIDRPEDLRVADKLFKLNSTTLGDAREITFITYLASIYRLGVLSRLKLQEPWETNYNEEIKNLWKTLEAKKSDWEILEAKKPDVEVGSDKPNFPFETLFHNLLELSSYFLGLDTTKLHGRHTFYTLPSFGSKNSRSYRILHSKNKFSEVRYPKKIAIQIAMSDPNAIVYQLDSIQIPYDPKKIAKQKRESSSGQTSVGRSNKLSDKREWLAVPNMTFLHRLNPPKEHSLEFLTWILYQSRMEPLPDDDNSRHVKGRLKKSLVEWSGCSNPFITVRTESTFVNPEMETPIIGVVHESVLKYIYDYDPSKLY